VAAPAGTSAAAATELTSPEWLSALLAETGEAGVSAGALESGFNAAISNAPWWSGLPVGVQNAIQGPIDTAATIAAKLTPLERLLSSGGAAALGYLGADKQADAMGDLADRYMAMGEPYRQKLAEISADPSVFYDSPTATKATDAVLRRLSVGGNPAGNPYAQALTIDALYDQYGRERDRLAGFGGLTQYNAAAPGASASAIGAEANKYNAIGAGLADYFNPPRRISLSDIFKTSL
jgi:hypothetical protein